MGGSAPFIRMRRPVALACMARFAALTGMIGPAAIAGMLGWFARLTGFRRFPAGFRSSRGGFMRHGWLLREPGIATGEDARGEQGRHKQACYT